MYPMICAPPYIYYRLYTNDKKGNLSEVKQMEYIDIAERRAKDLQNLLSDFFELSIIELPDYYIELQKININNILCEVIASFIVAL